MAALNDILAVMAAMGILAPLQTLIVIGVATAIYMLWVKRS